jgi:hypothetical protein
MLACSGRRKAVRPSRTGITGRFFEGEPEDADPTKGFRVIDVRPVGESVIRIN